MQDKIFIVVTLCSTFNINHNLTIIILDFEHVHTLSYATRTEKMHVCTLYKAKILIFTLKKLVHIYNYCVRDHN